ncbi:hypothetical protein ASD91_12085 [Pseudomonas sp. Root68]|nr:hypothetical protein ASD91_12085 [Pseudomonas sp. Root68]KRB71968.1 hypothetical protein ASD95_01445 [Pseudomonas sp. Root71]
MRRPALALAWLSRWLLLKQTLLPEPGWLAWQPVRWLAWRQPAFSLQVWPLVLQRVLPQQVWRQLAWQRPAWRRLLVSLQLVLRLVWQPLLQQVWQRAWLLVLQRRVWPPAWQQVSPQRSGQLV